MGSRAEADDLAPPRALDMSTMISENQRVASSWRMRKGSSFNTDAAVCSFAIPSAAAGLVRSHLDAEWRDGSLPLFNSASFERRVVRYLHGFAGYGQTVAPYNSVLQADITLLFNPRRLG